MTDHIITTNIDEIVVTEKKQTEHSIEISISDNVSIFENDEIVEINATKEQDNVVETSVVSNIEINTTTQNIVLEIEPEEKVVIITETKIGPQGPKGETGQQGEPGQQVNSLEAMIHPDFPETYRTFENGPYGISAINVFEKTGTKIFSRIISYGDNGLVIVTQSWLVKRKSKYIL